MGDTSLLKEVKDPFILIQLNQRIFDDQIYQKMVQGIKMNDLLAQLDWLTTKGSSAGV